MHVGDLVSYRVTTRRPGWLVIFDATPDGRLTQIFPNALSLRMPGGAAPEAGMLLPERPRLIPDPRNAYEGFAVKIEEPRGSGVIVAVLSDKPLTSLELPSAPRTFAAAEAAAVIGRLRGELTRGLRPAEKGEPNRARSPGWSVAARPYSVRGPLLFSGAGGANVCWGRNGTAETRRSCRTARGRQGIDDGDLDVGRPRVERRGVGGRLTLSTWRLSLSLMQPHDFSEPMTTSTQRSSLPPGG